MLVRNRVSVGLFVCVNVAALDNFPFYGGDSRAASLLGPLAAYPCNLRSPSGLYEKPERPHLEYRVPVTRRAKEY